MLCLPIKKTGNYNISINEDVIGSFGIKSIQDYVNVQRSVKNTLLNEGFFSDEGANYIKIKYFLKKIKFS